MLLDRNPLDSALRQLRPAITAVLGLAIFINLLLFVTPIYSLQIYDRVLASRNLGTLGAISMMVVFFLAASALIDYARAGVLIRSSRSFAEVMERPAFDLSVRAQLAGREALAAGILEQIQAERT